MNVISRRSYCNCLRDLMALTGREKTDLRCKKVPRQELNSMRIKKKRFQLLSKRRGLEQLETIEQLNDAYNWPNGNNYDDLDSGMRDESFDESEQDRLDQLTNLLTAMNGNSFIQLDDLILIKSQIMQINQLPQGWWIESNLLAFLIRCLTTSEMQLKREAMTIITVISGDSIACNASVEAIKRTDLVRILIHLMPTQDYSLIRSTVLTLFNMVDHSMVVGHENEMLTALFTLLNWPNLPIPLLIDCIKLIGNICKNYNLPVETINYTLDLISRFFKLYRDSEDVSIYIEVCRTLAYIMKRSDDTIVQLVCNYSLDKELMEILRGQRDGTIKTLALEAFSCMFHGVFQLQDYSSLLQNLSSILKERGEVRRAALRFIESSIFKNSFCHREAVTTGLVSQVVNEFEDGNLENQKCAMKALSQFIAQCDESSQEYLMPLGIENAFLRLINSRDAEVSAFALNEINNLVGKFGNLYKATILQHIEKIVEIQYDCDYSVAIQATTILRNHFMEFMTGPITSQATASQSSQSVFCNAIM